jgi:hypothetical protein
VVTGALLVVTPTAAEAGIARCEVTAREPRGISSEPTSVYVEGFLSCDPAILAERFTHTVCLQVERGSRFVDVDCCRIIAQRVSRTPWLMCGEDKQTLPGTHRYRTRATTARRSNGNAETDYSTTRKFTL